MRRAFALTVALVAGPTLGMTGVAFGGSTFLPQQTTPPPTFRTGVSRVAVAATVRDKKGRPVPNLTSKDFELVDSGRSREIAEFRSETSPVSLAMMVDDSGSMDIGDKRAAALAVAEHLINWLTPGKDQVALLAFHQYLDELQPLTPAPGQIREKLATLRSYGRTAIYDAIAEAGRHLATHGGPRRALVVLTDGADNASKLTAGEVSGLASSIDVPVYVVVVVSPLDQSDKDTPRGKELAAMLEGRLGDLARWTGGDIFAAVSPAASSIAARQIVSELRHQYLITFEPSRVPGWHPIDLRARDKGLVVRARSGYVVQSSPDRLFVF
jgi:Ca-activated chloride channel family protein